MQACQMGAHREKEPLPGECLRPLEGTCTTTADCDYQSCSSSSLDDGSEVIFGCGATYGRGGSASRDAQYACWHGQLDRKCEGKPEGFELAVWNILANEGEASLVLRACFCRGPTRRHRSRKFRRFLDWPLFSVS